MDKADTAALHIHLFFIALSPSGFFMQSDSPPLRLKIPHKSEVYLHSNA
jgi:hypothetical protein